VQGTHSISAPIRLRSALRSPDLARTAGFGLVVLALELILAHGLVGPSISKVVFLFVGVVAAAVLLRFPMATALLLIVLTDFIFYPTAVSKEVGPISLRAHDVALALLLLLAVVSPKRRTWGGTAGTALAIFLVMVGLSDLVSVKTGNNNFHEAVAWARPLFLLTLFYVIVRLFPSVEQRRTLLLGAAIVAALTGLVALAASTGGGLADTLKNAAPETIRASEGSIDRVRLPGLSMGYGLFWYTVVQVVARRGRPRVWWSLLLAGIAVDILVSFNRNMWIGVTMGLALMAVFGGTFLRSRLTVGVAAVVAAVVAVVIFGGQTTDSKVVQPVVQRASTLLSPGKTSRESSLTEREQETKIALKTAKAHPLLGVGAGASFGKLMRQPNSGSVTGYILVPQPFLHNQYVYLVLISGVPGLIAFLFFLLTPVAQAIRRAPRDPAITACGVGIVMIMLSAIVAIYFTVENMTVVLALLTGVIVADHEGRAATEPSSGLLE
jgi:O-antigen ligase